MTHRKCCIENSISLLKLQIVKFKYKLSSVLGLTQILLQELTGYCHFL